MAHSENLYEGLMNHGFSEEEIDRLIDKMNK
jgi:SOS response regulatory protein OraA/RecX